MEKYIVNITADCGKKLLSILKIEQIKFDLFIRF